MFWKKKAPDMGRKEPRIAEPAPPPPSDTERLENAARDLARSLRAYADASNKAAIGQPDPALQAAEAKVAAARNLILNSRLAYALGRCIPEHVKYWPSWSKNEDFQRWVYFDALEITAEATQKIEGSRSLKIATIGFVFNGTRYTVVLTDKGYSSGAIEFWEGSNLVAHFELREMTKGDFWNWEYSDVLALRVGPWMQDVLDIAAQIDAGEARQMKEFHETRVRDAAKNIDLG